MPFGGTKYSPTSCVLATCVVTKSEKPGHRKFERCFHHADVEESKLTGEYLIAHDP
jgi:hypothetical protein